MTKFRAITTGVVVGILFGAAFFGLVLVFQSAVPRSSGLEARVASLESQMAGLEAALSTYGTALHNINSAVSDINDTMSMLVDNPPHNDQFWDSLPRATILQSSPVLVSPLPSGVCSVDPPALSTSPWVRTGVTWSTPYTCVPN